MARAALLARMMVELADTMVDDFDVVDLLIVELFEAQAHDGPGMECFRTAAPVFEEDLAAPTRWPEFSALAVRLGLHAVGAPPMRLRGEVIGALACSARRRGPCRRPTSPPPRRWPTWPPSGSCSTAPPSKPRSSTQLQHALNSRIIIEQAKGTVAARMGLEMPDAFERLRRYARNRNVRLAEVAEDVVHGRLSPAALS
jgi:hypothetical protein